MVRLDSKRISRWDSTYGKVVESWEQKQDTNNSDDAEEDAAPKTQVPVLVLPGRSN